MKSYIFKITSLLLFFSFISCSDSSEDTNEFSIVGEWRRTNDLVDGERVTDDCQDRNVIKFESDATFTGTYYVKYTECEILDSDFGLWELTGDSVVNDRIINIYLSTDSMFFDSERTIKVEFINNNKIKITHPIYGRTETAFWDRI